jgi:hypothetical protein
MPIPIWLVIVGAVAAIGTVIARDADKAKKTSDAEESDIEESDAEK